MKNETKQFVFEVALNHATKTGWLDYEQMMNRYDDALVYDLPLLPKVVSEYLRKAKAPHKWGLLDVFWHIGDGISAMGIDGLYGYERWIVDNQNTFARAWLLGVWKVQETGKIVKLEAAK